MEKQKEKSEALVLRREGRSIGAIAKVLGVSKSTVSFWCKDITLTNEQIQKISSLSKHHATSALLKSAEKQRKDRQLNISSTQRQGRLKVGKISDRDIFMVGLGLYWGEGYKKGSQELGFTNSDPNMIPLYIKWLKKVYGVTKDRLILRVSINEYHTNRNCEVLNYWSELTQVPLTQFTKTSFIKTYAKKQKYTEKHYGTLRVKVRNGTFLRHEILASIAALR